MKGGAITFFSGLLFALGLGISGMTQPAKVTSFLDFSGNWDPSLLFVMVGAITIYAIGYRIVVRRPKPVFAEAFQIPHLRKIDRDLISGAMLFGVGWGLAGFCPGPALTSLVAFSQEAWIFTGAMLLGMSTYSFNKKRKRR